MHAVGARHVNDPEWASSCSTLYRGDRNPESSVAEDAWNNRNPDIIALAYSVDSLWRNRNEFLSGREAIVAFLRRKWALWQSIGMGSMNLDDSAIRQPWRAVMGRGPGTMLSRESHNCNLPHRFSLCISGNSTNCAGVFGRPDASRVSGYPPPRTQPSRRRSVSFGCERSNLWPRNCLGNC